MTIKNFPPCCPVVHHDIANDIPDFNKNITRAYVFDASLSYMTHVYTATQQLAAQVVCIHHPVVKHAVVFPADDPLLCRGFMVFLFTCISLTYNFVCSLIGVTVGNVSGNVTAAVFFAAIYAILGIPGAWYLWCARTHPACPLCCTTLPANLLALPMCGQTITSGFECKLLMRVTGLPSHATRMQV